MKHSIKTGLNFGLTSGIITTLGLMTGLNAGTHSESVVIGGILTIAVADAFSDALGIHMAEESENKHTAREIWEATTATFASKFIFTLTFLVPVLLFNLSAAIAISIIWGLLWLIILSTLTAKNQKMKLLPAVFEHLLIAIAVIAATHQIGDWLAGRFS
ncbi:MAG: VIT1/CCC1 transporter family protein [Patescibacteria group bacterium]